MNQEDKFDSMGFRLDIFPEEKGVRFLTWDAFFKHPFVNNPVSIGTVKCPCSMKPALLEFPLINAEPVPVPVNAFSLKKSCCKTTLVKHLAVIPK